MSHKKTEDLLPKRTSQRSKDLKKEMKETLEDFFTSDNFEVEFIN